MAASPVNLSVDLQAWHFAGLSFLYLPEVDVSELLAYSPRPVHGVPETLLGGFSASRRVELHKKKKNDIEGVSEAFDTALLGARCSGVPSVAKTAIHVAESVLGGVQGRYLPKVWQDVSIKIKCAPVVWSYTELGEDLLGQASPERRLALQKLITELGLKAGTSTFLPVALPGRPQDGSDAWCFTQILAHTGGKVLVFLGEETLALGPYAGLALGQFEEKIVDGRLILCLPAFAGLLTSPKLFGAMQTFLRSAFAKIKIL